MDSLIKKNRAFSSKVSHAMDQIKYNNNNSIINHIKRNSDLKNTRTL